MFNYNWKEILKSKSDSELISFFNSKLTNDHEAKYFAICEMESRNIEKANIESMKKSLITDCKNHIKTLNQESLKDSFVPVKPYIMLGLSIFLLISLLFSSNFSIRNPRLIGSLFFGITGIISLFVSKQKVKDIKITKRRNIEAEEKVINNLTIMNQVNNS